MSKLYFPPLDDKGQPQDNLAHQNGVDYTWDKTSNSWVILSSQSVTKNYVDSRDQLRYRRDGIEHLYGDVRILEDPDENSNENITIRTDGTIIAANESHLVFSSERAPQGGRISYGNKNNPTTLLEFTSSLITYNRPFNIDTSKLNGANRLQIIQNSLPEVILYDLQQSGSSTSKAALVVKLPDIDTANFIVRAGDNEQSVNLNSQGTVKVINNQDESFIVTNTGSYNDPPFRIDARTHKVYLSEACNEALMSPGFGGEVPSPSGKTFIAFDEDNLVVTKAYVDANGANRPGRNICADREVDAEPGGFWRDGSGIWLRIG